MGTNANSIVFMITELSDIDRSDGNRQRIGARVRPEQIGCQRHSEKTGDVAGRMPAPTTSPPRTNLLSRRRAIELVSGSRQIT